MSDIIYTPPASSGGGQNPTTNYIPLNNGTSNFVDSILFNDRANFVLYAVNNLNYPTGLYLDINNNNFSFGELTGNYTGFTNLNISQGYTTIYDVTSGNSFFNITNTLSTGNTTFSINADNQLIKTQNNNNDIGLKLDFGNENYFFGDFNFTTNGIYLLINNNNGQIQSSGYGSSVGLNLDFSINSFYLGDYNFNINGTFFLVDDNSQIISTQTGAQDVGLKLDFSNNLYEFGDFLGVSAGTLLRINDATQNVFLGSLDGDTTGLIYYRILDTLPNSCNVALGDYADGLGFIFSVSDTPTNDYLNIASNYNLSLSSQLNGITQIIANGTNTNSFLLDPNTDKMTFTTGNLNFVGAGLLSNTAGGSSGKHLVLTIQGTQYKIALNNI